MVDFAAGLRSAAVRAYGTLLIGVLLLSGCTTSLSQWWHNGLKVGPQYARPPAPVADKWIDSADPRIKSEPAQDCAWWTVFNDSTLNGLIETAYQQNLDLRAAGTRILQSRAQRNIAIGNLFPQSQTAQADYAHAQLSKNLGLPLPSSTISVWADGMNLSWEIDFWGRYRRRSKAPRPIWTPRSRVTATRWSCCSPKWRRATSNCEPTSSDSSLRDKT